MTKVVIYTSGETAHQQFEQCQQLCERRGYAIVAVAHDRPGSDRAWHDAQRMVSDGSADRIVYASSSVTPSHLESVTSAWVWERAGDQRPRPLRRGEAT